MFSAVRKLSKSTGSKSFCLHRKKKLNNVGNPSCLMLCCIFTCMSGVFPVRVLHYKIIHGNPVCAIARLPISPCVYKLRLCLRLMSSPPVFSGCIIGLFVALYLSAIFSLTVLPPADWLSLALFAVINPFSTLAHSTSCVSNAFSLLHSVRSLKNKTHLSHSVQLIQIHNTKHRCICE